MLTDKQILDINASIDDSLAQPAIDQVERTVGAILTILQDKFGVTDEEMSRAEAKWLKMVEDLAKPQECEPEATFDIQPTCPTCSGKGWCDNLEGGVGPNASTKFDCPDCGGTGIA